MKTEAITASLQLLQERTQIAPQVCYIAEVGSRAQGVSQAASDFDSTAVWVETFGQMVSGRFKPSRQVRTKPQGVRSGIGDVDCNLYTARHVTHLMIKGNPSIQEAIASPTFMTPNVGNDQAHVLAWLETLQAVTYSRASLRAYLGYMTQQKERWLGERGQKNVSRPELVLKYGYDTKYVGHIYRLGRQAVEYVQQKGKLTLPYNPGIVSVVQAIRGGAFTEAQALEIVEESIKEVEDFVENYGMPDKPDTDAAWAATEKLYRRIM